VRDAKVALDALSQKVLDKINDEKAKAINKIQNIIDDFKQKEEFIKLSNDQQNKIASPFEEEIVKLQTQRYIGNIRNVVNHASEHLYPKQLNEMIRLLTPVEPSGNVVNDPTPHYIRSSAVKISFPKSELRTEEDVEEYIDVFKKALLEKIRDNKRISL
jgi:uncharacterized protein (UPF0147 family)